MLESVCGWAAHSMLEREYHDREWGVPLHDDRKLFEMLVLETMQSGMSLFVVLKKREEMRKAFDNFDCKIIADYNNDKFQKLMVNKSLIQNRLKISAVVHNAKAFCKVQEKYESFDRFIWSYVENKPIINSYKDHTEIPQETELSAEISKDLKDFGFRSLGPVAVYSFMQTIGMVNNHIVSCARYEECCKLD